MNPKARGVILTMVAAAAAALAAPGLAAAQDDGELMSPRPKYCTSSPVALEDLMAMRDAAGTPAADAAGSEAEAEAGPLAGVTEITREEIPAGTAADAETVKAIEDLELIYASCYNQGAFLQAAALLSERGQRALAELAADPAVAARFATPEAFKKEQRIPGIAVENVQLYEDGIVGAVVTWAPGDPRQEVNLHLYVKGDDGLWYIDREIAVNAAAQAGTPEAEGTPEA